MDAFARRSPTELRKTLIVKHDYIYIIIYSQEDLKVMVVMIAAVIAARAHAVALRARGSSYSQESAYEVHEHTQRALE